MEKRVLVLFFDLLRQRNKNILLYFFLLSPVLLSLSFPSASFLLDLFSFLLYSLSHSHIFFLFTAALVFSLVSFTPVCLSLSVSLFILSSHIPKSPSSSCFLSSLTSGSQLAPFLTASSPRALYLLLHSWVVYHHYPLCLAFLLSSVGPISTITPICTYCCLLLRNSTSFQSYPILPYITLYFVLINFIFIF